MFINQTNSTNDWLKSHPETDFVWTTWQTAGRGQAGNTWESEKGKNILLSLRLKKPNVPIAQQFRITMAVSIAVRDLVASLLPNNKVTIKWPNDIYIGDKKVCGILIENKLSKDCIEESIIGIGLNINQTSWQGDAPNPISVKQITSVDYDLETIINQLCETLTSSLNLIEHAEVLKANYLSVLYRFGEKSWYAPREVSITPSRILNERPANAFEATIKDITPEGELVLDNKKFHFKEIQFII